MENFRVRSNRIFSSPKEFLFSIVFLLLVLPSAEAIAQGDFFNTVAIDLPNQPDTNTDYSLFGWITQKAGYGLEAPGAPFSRQQRDWNKVESSVFVQFDTSINDNTNLRVSGKAYHDVIYTLNDDIDFSADERNKFHTRYEIKDLFLERQFENGAYLKLGNQLFAWGLAEYSRVTDLINTEDQFTFGQQDLEDIRLQVPAALLSFRAGNWTLDNVVTYDAGRNDLAPAGDEFDQFLRLREAGYSLSREQPKRRYETFVRASTHWAKGDLQIVAGDFNDNSLAVTSIAATDTAIPHITYSQNRMKALGVAGNWVNGAWLYFAEMGIQQDKAVRPNAASYLGQLQGWGQKDQILSVMGVEYNGLRNLVLTFELDNTHTRQHDESMLDSTDQIGIGARVYWTTLNERLKLIAVWNELVDADSNIGRVSVNYSWSDSLESGLLWMHYGSQRGSAFYDYRNNDILQFQLRYSFQF